MFILVTAQKKYVLLNCNDLLLLICKNFIKINKFYLIKMLMLILGDLCIFTLLSVGHVQNPPSQTQELLIDQG